MPITEKTRKILWGKSGNRCALCRRELVMDGTKSDDPSVVGDECHIISSKRNGPRGNENDSLEDYNNYSNLLLLCKVHHKVIDDQVNTFTPVVLTNVKRKHEEWVKNSLESTTEPRGEKLQILSKVLSGKDLMAMSSNCLAYLLDHDETDIERECDAIGSFLQNVKDWSEIWDSIEIPSRMKAQKELSIQIGELGELGFSVFAKQDVRTVRVRGATPVWPVLLLVVTRKSNPGITPVGDLSARVRESR